MCFTPGMLICSTLTPQQVQQLAIPTYQLSKQEKSEGDKNLDLVDPSGMTVISAIAFKAI